jgi:hypothetical protein
MMDHNFIPHHSFCDLPELSMVRYSFEAQLDMEGDKHLLTKAFNILFMQDRPQHNPLRTPGHEQHYPRKG